VCKNVNVWVWVWDWDWDWDMDFIRKMRFKVSPSPIYLRVIGESNTDSEGREENSISVNAVKGLILAA